MTMKENTIIFGNNLKELRKKSGYTRAQLANIISYSVKAVEKWESGNSVPPVNTVCRIAELFGVTVDSLLFAPKTEVRYLLGIDGGGTKTEFLLTTFGTERKEVARIILGPSNPVDLGMEACKNVLEQGIRQICAGINLRQVCAFAGLSGGTLGDNQAVINSFLSRFGFNAFENGNDVHNALEIALEGGDGVAIIMGTGIIAYAMKDGVQHRVAGWGPHIDKGGSGYNYGSDALDLALKSLDGRLGSSVIRELVEKQLGCAVTDAIPDIYRGGKTSVASFAPTIFRAYKMGDEMAGRVIDANVSEVAQIIKSGLDYIGDRKAKVVACGSICEDADVLLPYFKKHLGVGINLSFSTERMVDGAVSLAERLVL